MKNSSLNTQVTFTHHSLQSFSKEQVGKCFTTPIAGLLALPIFHHRDQRGFFVELGKIPEINSTPNFVKNHFTVKQLNHAHSVQYVARGYHAENWNKLITNTQGLAFMSIADIRQNSPSFGHTLDILSGPSSDLKEYDLPVQDFEPQFLDFLKQQHIFTGSLFLPAGVANSACALTQSIDYIYAVDALYEERDPAGDTSRSLFDPTINTTWPFSKSKLIMSQRDKNGVPLNT
jgi:dTDP-4-dehydrorhamnose 3,5-epimerase-like enzyme